LASWSRDQLAEIERQLVPILGPVARELVREAAATTGSRQEVYRLLATHLRTAEERQRFLLAGDRTGTGSIPPPDVAHPASTLFTNAGSRNTGPTLSTNTGQSSSNIASRPPLSAEVTQRASQLLARYMGPIATVLTRRAAQTAADEAHLYSILAEKLTDTAERERFLREAGRPH
jgi:serine/threonine-protein kinase